METYDVLIVGGGITGCSIAWNSVRQGYRTALVEKACDVATGATRANSGILHSGIHETPGTTMFRLCRDGISWYRKWSQKLDFQFLQSTSVILADSAETSERLTRMAENHAATLSPTLLGQPAIRERWPFIGHRFVAALTVNDSARISPYDACRAIFENAVANGLKTYFNRTVSAAVKSEDIWNITIGPETIASRLVIVAAGPGGNDAGSCFGLTPVWQKLINGAYYLMRRKSGPEFDEIFFGPGSQDTKGILVQRTVHGNLMLGPDAISRDDLNGSAEQHERLCRLWGKCSEMIGGLDRRDILRTFSGDRVQCGSEFVIEDHLQTEGILRLSGIKSPGLTVAPALAADIVAKFKVLLMPQKQDCIESRLSIETSCSGKPGGKIVCRCEKVYMAAVKEAIRRGADCIEALRWQTRAGMGDCQGSFCRPALIQTLKTELGLKTSEICLRDHQSQLFTGDLK